MRIKRKGHYRHGYARKGTRVEGGRVSGSSFDIKDRGKKGRGPKILPALKKGKLGVKFSQSASARRRQEAKHARREGEKKVIGRLRAVQILNKRTNPIISEKARADARWIAGSFRGRKRVKTGTGFGGNR